MYLHSRPTSSRLCCGLLCDPRSDGTLFSSPLSSSSASPFPPFPQCFVPPLGCSSLIFTRRRRPPPLPNRGALLPDRWLFVHYFLLFGCRPRRSSVENQAGSRAHSVTCSPHFFPERDVYAYPPPAWRTSLDPFRVLPGVLKLIDSSLAVNLPLYFFPTSRMGIADSA